MKLNYAIIGTGGLGAYYGGRLAQSGQNVHFLFHSDYQYALKNGIKIDSVKGDFEIPQVNAYSSTQQMPLCDVVFVCLKTTNNYLLKEMLPSILHEYTEIILLQNGLGMEEELAKEMPDLSISGGLAYICASKLGPGHYAHYDLGNITLAHFRGENKKLLSMVCDDLNKANVPANLSANLQQTRWEKLVWNIPFNGMAVKYNTSTDNLMKQADTRLLARELMQEVVEGARHCGLDVKDEYADKMMKITDKMIPYAPSMKLDFDFKRPMEIQAIYTNPIQAALKAGYNMQRTNALAQELTAIQKTYLQ